MEKHWVGKIVGAKILDNLYFIGGFPASIHVLDTGEGLMVIDTGYTENREEYLKKFIELGLDIKDIRLILLTHGHIDHIGNARYFREKSGAPIAIGEADKDYVNGKADLTYAKEFEMNYTEPFEADILLKDGDEIKAGNTTVKAKMIPGHTEGAMCYFFNINVDGKEYTAGIHGGMGVNTLSVDYLSKNGLPLSLRKDFVDKSKELAAVNVDIYLGNHAAHNRTFEKIEEIEKGEKYAFICPGEWQKSVNESIKTVNRMIEEGK